MVCANRARGAASERFRIWIEPAAGESPDVRVFWLVKGRSTLEAVRRFYNAWFEKESPQAAGVLSIRIARNDCPTNEYGAPERWARVQMAYVALDKYIGQAPDDLRPGFAG